LFFKNPHIVAIFFPPKYTKNKISQKIHLRAKRGNFISKIRGVLIQDFFPPENRAVFYVGRLVEFQVLKNDFRKWFGYIIYLQSLVFKRGGAARHIGSRYNRM
jgi:hypothetical protein